ncbi:hypothetical protein SRABI70_00883 [Pseudomonas sp. Bi70]|uniref:VPA1269 family protein n=1 Tax=Pseudomonas sp. Bi70 TaxID=2821127 RepID=UPI001D60F1AD|nr:VPA1269 family protein [Pseudomonas sp. Bi70]CAH0165820.1 hypothetical protein SRABI70_00883 [Pseudomonas sp. Bi70]
MSSFVGRPSVERFTSSDGQTEVMINLHQVEAYVDPSLTEDILRQIIAEHEAIRIDEYWSEFLTASFENRGYINAFKTTKADGFITPMIMQSRALSTLFKGELKGKDLIVALRALPIDEQVNFINSLKVSARSGLGDVLKTKNVVFAPDYREMLAECGSPENFVQYLVKESRRNGTAGYKTPEYHIPRYLELLTILWSRNLILFPQDIHNWPTRSKWLVLANYRYSLLKFDFIKSVKASITEAYTDYVAYSYTFLATCSAVTAKDLTPGLIDAFETFKLTYIDQLNISEIGLHGRRSVVSRVAEIFRLHFNQENPGLAIKKTRTAKRNHRAGPLKTDGTFEWIQSANPALGRWAECFSVYVSSLKTARVGGQIGRLNKFGDYLLTLEDPPVSPEAVTRSIHMNDALKLNDATYWAYLKRAGISGNSANAAMSQLRDFYNWYIDYSSANGTPAHESIKNPVSEKDKIGVRERTGQTKRNALPGYVLNELKAILTEDNYAFSKSIPTHYVRVIDKETGKLTKTWYPSVNNCLFFMLEMPVRNHQGRWLDSGELDESVFDERAGELIRNTSPYSILGRKECVLRLNHDSLRKSNWIGLWINTNKTANYDGREIGYSIPYASSKLTEVIQLSIRWGARYLPPMTAPIPYYGEKYDKVDRVRINEKGPQVTPLFRDPKARTFGAPFSYDRLANFYTRVLAEAQRRIKDKYGHELKLVEKNEDGELSWLVDLHTLRVSGITSMIESGVPLEIVSMFVAGHQTLVMTLHYLRYSPLKIRELLSEAHEQSLKNIDLVGSEMFLEDFDQFAKFLVGQGGQAEGAGIEAIRNKTGIMTIGVDGICPGTSCSDGGPVDSTKVVHGPVPGGQRCGLCRHWLTGPGFLLGQVATVNNLAYSIRKKGLELARLNDERLSAEDNGNQRKARELRDRADLMNRELAIDIEEWVSRYHYAEQSVTLMDQYIEALNKNPGHGHQLALLSSSSAAELKVTLEESHEFALLDQITQMADFVTGFANREATYEKHAILSQMLMENGMSPFLLRLTPDQAHQAGNLMSSMLLQQVESHHLDDVLTGKRKLSAYPHLKGVIDALEASGNTDSQLVISALQPSLIECVEL